MNNHLKQSYYIDSNVFLSVNNSEYKKFTRYFFSKLFDNHFSGVISSITWEDVSTEKPELLDLPTRYWRKSLPYMTVAEISDSSLKLARTYIESGIFESDEFVTALNIAIASINRCDGFVSWDYRAIVNRQTKSKLMGINKLLGHPSLELYTPAML